MEMDMDVDQMEGEIEETNKTLVEKRKTHVGCWKNKTEFIQVYSWLFDEKYINNDVAKQKALKQMKIWKLRRLNLTPASVLSTIVLTEVQLKDNPTMKSNQLNSDEIDNELRILYSSSFIRFFNYMSSIMQSKKLRSMYDIARELKIESFIVDLRHLCSHGQLMPELSILRNALDYCVKWIKQYYWDNELNNMIDVTSDNIRLHDLTQIDKNITHLFQLYDKAFELRYKNCNMIDEGKKLNELYYSELIEYSNMTNTKHLKGISKSIIKDLSKIIKREPGLKDLSQIYIEAFLKMHFFFESAANHADNFFHISNLIKCSQDLFKSIANHGFLEELFLNLIVICEKENEADYKRKGCGFWAHKIAEGFIAYKQLQIYYKNIKDNNKINPSDSVHSIHKIISRSLSIDCNTTLIFSDHFRRPWSLQFNWDYIQERINKINVYTKNVITSCVVLINPPLPVEKCQRLTNLIKAYCNVNKPNSKLIDSDIDDIFYIKDGEIKKGTLDGSTYADIDDNLNETKIGVWSMNSETENWSSYPLGRLMW